MKELLGSPRSDSPLSTALAANSIGGTGRAGNIEINTRFLRVDEGASISSSSGVSSGKIQDLRSVGDSLGVWEAESVWVWCRD